MQHLQKNKKREVTDGANPRAKNIYGQIIRWNPSSNNHLNVQFNGIFSCLLETLHSIQTTYVRELKTSQKTICLTLLMV